MINLKNCKYGDKLITKDGQVAIYLGRIRPLPSKDRDDIRGHAVIGFFSEILNTGSFRSYNDEGIVVDKNGKPDNEYREEEIVEIRKLPEIDLSRCKSGDIFVTKSGIKVRLVGYKDKTGYYEMEIIYDIIDNKLYSCDKRGYAIDPTLYNYDIIDKIEDSNDKSE